jgi:hypothetical protein
MTTAAIKAQGTTLEISSGTGGAEPLTAVTATAPAICTSTAHALVNGDVVTITGIVGTLGTNPAEGLNGNTYVVTDVTTNTFALAGTNCLTLTYTSDGTATPVAYTLVNECKSFTGFDGEAGETDVTSLDSTAKEFLSGLRDYGGISFEMNWLGDDTGQVALRAAADSGLTKNWKLTLISGTNDVAAFSGFVKSVPIAGGVDAAVTGSFRIRITGAVVWS